MIRAKLNGKTLELVRDDITKQKLDALVTAANAQLAGGGGVDGAVHRAAGPQLLEACHALGGCPTGDAVATPAFDLPVKRVIHAVGPRFGESEGKDDELLASAHRRAMEVAAAEGCTSIAFPAISCGVYGFPVDRASRVALRTLRDVLLGDTPIKLVRYVLFAEKDYGTFGEALREIAEEDPRVDEVEV